MVEPQPRCYHGDGASQLETQAVSSNPNRVSSFENEPNMEVSINGGTLESSNLLGYSTINHPFYGVPAFMELPYGFCSKPLNIDSHQSLAIPHIHRWKKSTFRTHFHELVSGTNNLGETMIFQGHIRGSFKMCSLTPIHWFIDELQHMAVSEKIEVTPVIIQF